MSDYKYHDKQENEDRKKLRELKKELPSFMKDYFRSIDTNATLKTQVAYAYDARMFFNYIKTHNPRSNSSAISLGSKWIILFSLIFGIAICSDGLFDIILFL